MKFWLFSTFLVAASSLFAVDTTISGGKMELKQKGEMLYFSDGVQLDRGTDRLKAQEMETNKARDKVNAKGKVQFFRRIGSSETYTGYGDRAFYATDQGEGYLIGTSTRAHVIYWQMITATATRNMDIYADRFDFMKTSSTVIGTGHVYGITKDVDTQDLYEFWAEKATYAGDKKIIELSGSPIPLAYQQTQTERKKIQGNVLTYDMLTKDFSSKGAARAIFVNESTGTFKESHKK